MCETDIMFSIYSNDILVSLVERLSDISAASPSLGPLWWDSREWEGRFKDEAKKVGRDQMIHNLAHHEKSVLYLNSHGELKKIEKGEQL